MSVDEIVIVGAARTPAGKFQGGYRDTPATALGAAALRAAVARAGADPALIDECVMGNVVSAGLGQAPARQAALGAGLPASVGGLTINKVCGSGLKAVMLAGAMVRAGDARLVAAGGMESMSRAPYLLPQARGGYRLGHGELRDALIHDGLWCAFEHQHMGASAEWLARRFGVSREAQDELAQRSQERALAARDAGAFDAELAPLDTPAAPRADEPPRRSDARTLAGLPPVFAADGTVTAGNAPGLTDGAAALLVTSDRHARELGLRPIARVLGWAQAGVAPLELFTAPVYAVRRLLQRLAAPIETFDLVEINEAFAAQAVHNARELGVDELRLNVHGGAIALGHPIGASGARVLTTLIYALRRRGGGRGIATLCLGGGEAVAMAVETV